MLEQILPTNAIRKCMENLTENVRVDTGYERYFLGLARFYGISLIQDLLTTSQVFAAKFYGICFVCLLRI